MDRRRLIMTAVGVCLLLVGSIAYLATGGRPTASADVRQAAAAPTSSAQPTLTPSSAAGSSGGPTASAAPATRASAKASTNPATATPRTPSQQAPLAGRIQPGASHQGVATAYAAGDGEGACLYDPSPDTMIAAMNVADYESSKACGASILIHAADGKSITVRIVWSRLDSQG